MDSIITECSNAEHAISSKIDIFFSSFSISKLLKKSNFYKESGIQCVVLLKEIFGLVFSGKNLFLKKVLNDNPFISEDIAHQIMDAFILALPTVWRQKLKLSA